MSGVRGRLISVGFGFVSGAAMFTAKDGFHFGMACFLAALAIADVLVDAAQARASDPERKEGT